MVIGRYIDTCDHSAADVVGAVVEAVGRPLLDVDGIHVAPILQREGLGDLGEVLVAALDQHLGVLALDVADDLAQVGGLAGDLPEHAPVVGLGVGVVYLDDLVLYTLQFVVQHLQVQPELLNVFLPDFPVNGPGDPFDQPRFEQFLYQLQGLLEDVVFLVLQVLLPPLDCLVAALFNPFHRQTLYPSTHSHETHHHSTTGGRYLSSPWAYLTLSAFSCGLKLSCLMSEQQRGKRSWVPFQSMRLRIFFWAAMQLTTLRMKSNLLQLTVLKSARSMYCGIRLTKKSLPKLVFPASPWIQFAIYSSRAVVYDFESCYAFSLSRLFLRIQSSCYSRGDLNSRLLSQSLNYSSDILRPLLAYRGHFRLKTRVFSSWLRLSCCRGPLRRSCWVTDPAVESVFSMSTMNLSSTQYFSLSWWWVLSTSFLVSFWYFSRRSMSTLVACPQSWQLVSEYGSEPSSSNCSYMALGRSGCFPLTSVLQLSILPLTTCSLLRSFSSGVPKQSSLYSVLMAWMGSQYPFMALPSTCSTKFDLAMVLNRNSQSILRLQSTAFFSRISTSLMISLSLLTRTPACFCRVISSLFYTRIRYLRRRLASSFTIREMMSAESEGQKQASFCNWALASLMKLLRKAGSKSLKRCSLKSRFKKARVRQRVMQIRSSWNYIESSLRKLSRQSLSVSIHSRKQPIVLRRVVSSMKMMWSSQLLARKLSFMNSKNWMSRQDFSFQTLGSRRSRAVASWYWGKCWLLMMLLRYFEKEILRKGLKTESLSQGRHHSTSSFIIQNVQCGLVVVIIRSRWVGFIKITRSRFPPATACP